ERHDVRAPALLGCRITLFRAPRQAGHFGARLLETNARLQPAEKYERPVVARLRPRILRRENQRSPKLGQKLHLPEGSRRDADDHILVAIERYRLSDDVRIGSKPSLPKAVSQHHNVIAARLIIAWQECAPQECRYPKRLEIIRGNEHSRQALRLTGSRKTETVVGRHESQTVERVVRVPPRQIINRR